MHRTEIASWTRRNVVTAGLASAGALALGACARAHAQSGRSATGSVGDLDDLARRIHGRFLTSGSRGYDSARKVWNLAYDRHPLAMARFRSTSGRSIPSGWTRAVASRLWAAERESEIS